MVVAGYSNTDLQMWHEDYICFLDHTLEQILPQLLNSIVHYSNESNSCCMNKTLAHSVIMPILFVNTNTWPFKFHFIVVLVLTIKAGQTNLRT